MAIKMGAAGSSYEVETVTEAVQLHELLTRSAYQAHAKSKSGRLQRKKEQTLRFRVSDEQKAELFLAAERAGLDFSVWIRQVALRAARLP